MARRVFEDAEVRCCLLAADSLVSTIDAIDVTPTTPAQQSKVTPFSNGFRPLAMTSEAGVARMSAATSKATFTRL